MNHILSLAWHKTAIKNGFFYSYVPAAELLERGSHPELVAKGIMSSKGALQRDRLNALVHYVAAY